MDDEQRHRAYSVNPPRVHLKAHAGRWEHEEMTESLHGHDDTPGGKS
jgi:hypothetical protein